MLRDPKVLTRVITSALTLATTSTGKDKDPTDIKEQPVVTHLELVDHQEEYVPEKEEEEEEDEEIEPRGEIPTLAKARRRQPTNL